MRCLVLILVSCLTLAAAKPPVYVLLWFDTEDYIQQAADDVLEKRGAYGIAKVEEKWRITESETDQIIPGWLDETPKENGSQILEEA